MTKTTRRAFLSSVVALVICLTMLIGTTFAWFTDTASTAVNTIQSGILDVDIVDSNGNSLEGKTLSFTDYYGYTNILWEPGVTFTTPEFKIVNKGNLALKYEVVLTGMQGDAKLRDVITIKLFDENNTEFSSGNLAAGAESGALHLSATMDKTAGNEYQGLTVDNIAITVYATQDTIEYDSTTNQYDKDATYSNGSNVINGNAVLNGTYIALDDNGNAVGDKNAVRVTGGDVIIEGGYYNGGNGGNNSAVRADAGSTVTIKGGYFTVGNDASGGVNNVIYADGGQITIEGGTFYSDCTNCNNYFILNAKDNSGGHITVKGGKFYKFNPAESGNKSTTSYVGDGEVDVADGYKVVQNGDWYYVVPENATTVSTADQLATAIAKGGNVVVTSDIEINSYINIATSTNIYLYDNSITRHGKDTTALYINDPGATVNIYGDGNVSAAQVAVWVNTGEVNIYGGTYTSLQAVYVMNDGVANIYGGTFKTENTDQYGSNYVLNQKDDYRETSSINVMGGTFIGFNPADNAAEGAGTDFVANGYHVEVVGDTYTVVAD